VSVLELTVTLRWSRRVKVTRPREGRCAMCNGDWYRWAGWRFARVRHTECWKRLGPMAIWLSTELGDPYIRDDPVPRPKVKRPKAAVSSQPGTTTTRG